MCGIGGCVLGQGGQPDRDRLVAMRDAMSHRGPDDSGIEVVGNVGLVHTRLSIVDLSPRGHQPMRHPDGEWWLAYNGEIYNHGVLRERLSGSAFVGTSDTETLLFSLERWGPDVVSELGGQFAFAALDARGSRLLLCRDRFGIKPLYFAEFDGGVWFASEPAALIAAGASSEPVDTAWHELSNGTYLGGQGTLLKGITRLPPGSFTEISLEDAAVTTWRWHVPTNEVDPVRAARLARRSRSELVAQLETTLRDAVHGSLLADTTVGTLCSGGIDSSLITALAVEAKPDMVAFGASFAGDGRKDEGLAARRVAEALGIELELVDVTPASWRRAFVPATVHFGVPIANASAVTVAQLAERARDCGVKVLLTGEGADELFGGYGRLHAAALADFLPWYDRVVHAAEPALLSDPMRALNPATVLRKTRDLVRVAVGPPPASTWLPVSTPGTGHGSTPESRIAYAHHEGERGELEAALLTHLDYSLCWLLNRMDKNVMQVSVEARVPFLEPEVVELVLNLPLEARVGPWSKGILRDVARRVLPWSIAHRPKIYGMAFDARTWIEEAANPSFLTDGLLRDTLQIPNREFQNVLAAGNHVVRVRLWSAEIWCRSLLAGHSIEQIEQDIWLEEPGSLTAPLLAA
ncbi:MAG: asparagine synthase (glutamine-hydrolyzing) [Solirubrobacterales bacterium]|nr:asparagine synthase (glutamine-hydrolyzing) [Solirubrobacterales bacterium]